MVFHQDPMTLGPAPRLRLYTTPRLYADVGRSLLARKVNTGNDVAVIERRIEKLLDAEHAIAMPMARVGIYAMIKHTIAPGQKVILSPYTISDVVNMVICAGGVPVFADIDRESCNVTADVDRQVDRRRHRRGVGDPLATGRSLDMDRIETVCQAHGVPLLEDAAQAFGAR